jgi:hypothetical protein
MPGALSRQMRADAGTDPLQRGFGGRRPRWVGMVSKSSVRWGAQDLNVMLSVFTLVLLRPYVNGDNMIR